MPAAPSVAAPCAAARRRARSASGAARRDCARGRAGEAAPLRAPVQGRHDGIWAAWYTLKRVISCTCSVRLSGLVAWYKLVSWIRFKLVRCWLPYFTGNHNIVWNLYRARHVRSGSRNTNIAGHRATLPPGPFVIQHNHASHWHTVRDPGSCAGQHESRAQDDVGA